jgi:hypothetical protein
LRAVIAGSSGGRWLVALRGALDFNAGSAANATAASMANAAATRRVAVVREMNRKAEMWFIVSAEGHPLITRSRAKFPRPNIDSSHLEIPSRFRES